MAGSSYKEERVSFDGFTHRPCGDKASYELGTRLVLMEEGRVLWDEFFDNETKTERKFSMPSGMTNVSDEVILRRYNQSKDYEKNSKKIYNWLKSQSYILRRFDICEIGLHGGRKDSDVKLIEDIFMEEEITSHPGTAEDIYICWLENKVNLCRGLYRLGDSKKG